MRNMMFLTRPAGTGLLALPILIAVLMTGPVAPASAAEPAVETALVDCVLPSKLKRIGTKFLIQAPRQTVQVSAADCESRGGEVASMSRDEGPQVAEKKPAFEREER